MIPASPEVIRHHGEEHGRRCPFGQVLAMTCEHDCTRVLACSQCRKPVYLLTRPGTNCHHAAEIRQGLTPSGLWTEVAAA
jgi:hypothetical protein